MKLSNRFRIKLTSFLILSVMVIAVDRVEAAVPRLMTYQGVLKDGSGNYLTGTYSIVFRIYSAATGGSALWTETQSSVSTSSGKFSVTLGSVTALSLDFNADYWMSIQVGADAEMSPRIRLTSAGYGIRADSENNGFTQTLHDSLSHENIAGVLDNSVIIAKTNFKLDAYTLAAANSMGDMVVDTFNDASGINSGASSSYTWRGTPNYDVTLTPTGGAVVKQNTSEDSPNGYYSMLYGGSYTAYQNGTGQRFQLSSQKVVDKVTFKGYKYGNPSGNFRVRVYSVSSGLPDTVLAESSDIPWNSLPEFPGWGSVAEITFSFAAVTLQANTDFIICIENINGSGDSSNFASINRSASDLVTPGELLYKNSSGAWSTYTSYDLYFKLFEQVTYSGTATVVSNSYTEPTPPTEAMVIVDETLGSGSITYYVSRDNGTTWTACTKETVTSISSQPSGTQLKWKAVITGNAELNSIAVAV